MGAYRISRERMVREHLVTRGITDPLVLKAMQTVPRHLFMPEAFIPQAYADCPIPIGFGQTISQPFVVAKMSQLLKAEQGMRVLEIGTGSGYQAAILFQMGLEVYTVERINELYNRSSNLFLQLRYRGIRCKLDDGTQGWPQVAPFDRIIVTAGGPSIPKPLLDQLADPGTLVIPVGLEKRVQHLVSVKKLDGVITETCEEQQVVFVDLVGQHGW